MTKLALLGLIFALAFWVLSRKQEQALGPGDVAPDFALPRLGAGKVSLRDYQQQVVILNFWATWCPPCVKEMPSLEQLARSTRPLGVVVIAVSVDEDLEALAKFMGGPYPSLLVARDPKRAVATRYGTRKYPETYIINREGKIIRKIVGAHDWQDPQVADYIRKLVGETPQS